MSLPEQPDTTLIRRLTVRGPSGTRERLLPQLEAAHWPAPPDHSWILVRRVAASASKSSLVEELLQKTQQRINSRDPAEVICFPTLAALLAALITDIYKGIAPQRWYWQRWSRLWQLPAGDAIQHLLQEPSPSTGCSLPSSVRKQSAQSRLAATIQGQCLRPARVNTLRTRTGTNCRQYRRDQQGLRCSTDTCSRTAGTGMAPCFHIASGNRSTAEAGIDDYRN